MKRGSHMTDEQRVNESAARMGHPYTGPQHHTAKTRAKISAAEMGPLNYGWGIPKSDKTRAKLSAAQMGNKNCLGRTVSEKTRAKISAALVGHKASFETRVKMSESQMGLSVETREKRSAAYKEKVGPLAPHWKGGKRLSQGRKDAKRRGLPLHPIFLNLWSPGKVGHHRDPDQVIFITETLHTSISHNVWTGKNMERINALAMQEAGLTSDVLDDMLPFD